MNFETACIYGFIMNISNNANSILSVNTQNFCIKPHFQCVLMKLIQNGGCRYLDLESHEFGFK